MIVADAELIPVVRDWLETLHALAGEEMPELSDAEIAQALVAESAAMEEAAVEECAGPDCPPVLAVPDEVQGESWSCGSACVAAVARFFSVEPDTEGEAIRSLGSSPRDGTDPERVIAVLEGAGLSTTAVSCMALEDLEFHVSKGRPVIVAYQAWGTSPDEYERLETGHWAVVIGVDDTYIRLMDPANFADGEDVAEYGGVETGPGQKVAVPRERFLSLWKDLDSEGNTYTQYGIVARGRVE